MATKQEIIDFVKKLYPESMYNWTHDRDNSLHPITDVAQAGLETGWQIKGIDNNIYGITKGLSWKGATKLVTTQLRYQAKYLLIGLFIGLAIGFYISRSTIDREIKTEYISGDKITGSVRVDQFIPIKEEKPSIQYRDTGSTRFINIPTDTAAIIADYEMKRTYKLVTFDDKKLGKLELYPVIQYNKLTALDYDFTPVIERQTIYKTKIWQPFVSGSYSTLNYVGIGGGVFYHNLGFEYQYQVSLGNQVNGNMFGLKYKF